MKCHRALLGTLAVLALALAPACRNTAEGVKQDSRENAEKAREGSEKAADETKDAAGTMSDQAAKAGEKIGDAAKDAGQAIKEGAKEVASEVDAKKQTVDVKTALMADKSVDASHIDVDTDADTKTVTLKGSVPTQAQKVKADKIAHEKAAGYKIVNQLTVSSKPSGPPSD
jgi:osmotically-inducible protein OsmY